MDIMERIGRPDIGHISHVPTFIFYKNGKEWRERVVGISRAVEYRVDEMIG